MLDMLRITIIGCAVGVVAKLIMPAKDPARFLLIVSLGGAGALLSTYLGQLIGWYRAEELAGLLAAAVGAVVLLVIYRLVRKRGASI